MMRETYVLGDLMQTLIRLEEHGNRLYTALVEKQTDESARSLFKTLADQELKHKKLYESLLVELEEVITPDEDYKGYIDILLKGTIDFLGISSDPKDHKAAYDIAVRLEKDTLLFLSEVRQIVPQSAHDTIEKVQAEERKHLQLLDNYWKTVVGGL